MADESNELLFVMKMRDEASAVLEKQGTEFERLAAKARKSGTTIEKDLVAPLAVADTTVLRLAKGFGTAVALIGGLYGVVAGIGGAFNKAVDEFVEAEEATKRLTQALEQTGFALGKTFAEVEAIAQKFSKISFIDDDEIKLAQAQLIQFGKVSGEVLEGATSVAVKLSQISGMGVRQAATLLSRSLVEPGKGLEGLRRFGIRLTESQIELIKTTRLVDGAMAAQAKQTQILEEALGAPDSPKGLTGAIKGTKKAYDDLFESLGGAVAPPTTWILDRTKAFLEGAKAITDYLLAQNQFVNRDKMIQFRDDSAAILKFEADIARFREKGVKETDRTPQAQNLVALLKGLSVLQERRNGLVKELRGETAETAKEAEKVAAGMKAAVEEDVAKHFKDVADALGLSSEGFQLINKEAKKFDDIIKGIAKLRDGGKVDKADVDRLQASADLARQQATVAGSLELELDLQRKILGVAENRRAEVQARIQAERDAVKKGEDPKIAGDLAVAKVQLGDVLNAASTKQATQRAIKAATDQVTAALGGTVGAVAALQAQAQAVEEFTKNASVNVAARQVQLLDEAFRKQALGAATSAQEAIEAAEGQVAVALASGESADALQRATVAAEANALRLQLVAAAGGETSAVYAKVKDTIDGVVASFEKGKSISNFAQKLRQSNDGLKAEREALERAQLEAGLVNETTMTRERELGLLRLKNEELEASAGLAGAELEQVQAIFDLRRKLLDEQVKTEEKLRRAQGPLQQFLKQKDDWEEYEQASVNALMSLEDALVDVSTASKTLSESIKDMAKSIIMDLERMAIRKFVTQPLGKVLDQFNPFGSPQSSGGGDTGGLAGMFSKLFGGLGGGGQSPGLDAGGNPLPPTGGGLGGMFSGIGNFFSGLFAKGGVFEQGKQVAAYAHGGAFDKGRDLEPVQKYARGGIVNTKAAIKFASGGVMDGGHLTQGPEYFGMAGGKLGLRGEAGTEAVMPLTRGSDGQLGVKTHGPASRQVIVNAPITVHAKDADSFKRSQSQFAGRVGDLARRGASVR